MANTIYDPCYNVPGWTESFKGNNPEKVREGFKSVERHLANRLLPFILGRTILDEDFFTSHGDFETATTNIVNATEKQMFAKIVERLKDPDADDPEFFIVERPGAGPLRLDGATFTYDTDWVSPGDYKIQPWDRYDAVAGVRPAIAQENYDNPGNGYWCTVEVKLCATWDGADEEGDAITCDLPFNEHEDFPRVFTGDIIGVSLLHVDENDPRKNGKVVHLCRGPLDLPIGARIPWHDRTKIPSGWILVATADGRFPVFPKAGDPDFGAVGDTGGDKEHTHDALAEHPVHTHADHTAHLNHAAHADHPVHLHPHTGLHAHGLTAGYGCLAGDEVWPPNGGGFTGEISPGPTDNNAAAQAHEAGGAGQYQHEAGGAAQYQHANAAVMTHAAPAALKALPPFIVAHDCLIQRAT